MVRIEVKYGKVISALGHIREGWIIFEDGRPGYPYKTKEQAEKAAEAIKQIRHVSR